MNFERIIEEQIRRAREEGAFDDLRGKGKPLSPREHPFVPPSKRLAYDALSNSGFSLPWIEERKQLDAAAKSALESLTRTRVWYLETISGGYRRWAEDEWQRAVAAFREEVVGLNRRIRVHNLKVPSTRLHRRLIDPVREIERVVREATLAVDE